MHASTTEHNARVLADWSRGPDRSSETVPGCELCVQLRDSLGLFIGRPSDDEDDDVLRSGHAVRRDVLPVDVRVAGLFQPAFQEQIDRFGKVGRMLRIDILDALCERRKQRSATRCSGPLKVLPENGRVQRKTATHLESLEGALSLAEKVLVPEQVVLSLIRARKVKHDVHHLRPRHRRRHNQQ